MKSKIFKPAFLVIVLFLAVQANGFAQELTISSSSDAQEVIVKTKVKTKDIQLKVDDLSKDLEKSLKEMSKSLSLSLNEITPSINADINNLTKSITISVNTMVSPDDADDNGDGNTVLNESTSGKEKIKNYTKTYSIDANDKIRLNNQYGKITVTTWDRHEVKVDVQIKAEANDNDYAQKLLDGVQINDSKNGDVVSFKTEIERNDGSWKIWNWGGNNKSHKLTINYTVYMPAKTDLDVEQSYGAIELPDLTGRVKISASYSSVSAQSLANASNEIEGSYGSLKVGMMNGGHLDFSYGSVDMEECTNLKADLSYGSFKLGKLKGTADLDLSYEGGFKIGELASSFKKLNVDASYSGVTLGIPGTNNFDFDVTTTYGGFNYSDNKVTVTSKTPPDGSKHIGPTRNYKGHFGKEGSEAQVNVHSTYGGVSFE